MKISNSNWGAKSCKLLIAWGLLILLLNTPLIASERTVCFRLKIRDDRSNCADISETGNRRGCNNGGYVYAVGHQVELWDKDADGNDEYIGTWYLNYSGTNCITFEWEDASYSKGKNDPDLPPVYKPGEQNRLHKLRICQSYRRRGKWLRGYQLAERQIRRGRSICFKKLPESHNL